MFITYLPVFLGVAIFALAFAFIALFIVLMTRTVRWARKRAFTDVVKQLIVKAIRQTTAKAPAKPLLPANMAVAVVAAIVVPGIRQVEWNVYDAPAYVRFGRVF